MFSAKWMSAHDLKSFFFFFLSRNGVVFLVVKLIGVKKPSLSVHAKLVVLEHIAVLFQMAL